MSMENSNGATTTHDVSDRHGVSFPSSSPSPILTHRKFLVSVEVCLKPSSTARIEDVRLAVERMLEKRSLSYADGPIPVPSDDQILFENVQRISVCDTAGWEGSAHDSRVLSDALSRSNGFKIPEGI
ncbi:hypothetical protein OIU84_009024 [Salix udensis]|uniref:Pachytene checkpoint protein 2 homolog n=1 Tax=Salix udensis TaxID=889485 RepID=A0AAD6NYC1_9ROSI|nr:hypothetical protein OIU84_009024 [Salix udensis]